MQNYESNLSGGVLLDAKSDLLAYEQFLLTSPLSDDSKKKYLSMAKEFVRFCESLGAYGVDAFTKSLAIEFSKTAQEEGLSLYTRKNYLYSAKSYIRFVLGTVGKEALYDAQVKGSFSLSDISPEIYPDDEIEKLLSHERMDRSLLMINNFTARLHYRLALRDTLIIRIMIETGMKSSELLDLKKGDIVLRENATVYEIHSLKTSHEALEYQDNKRIRRSIKKHLVHDYLHAYHDSLPLMEDGDTLFVSKTFKPLDNRSLERILEDYCARADVPYRSVKALRHTYARKKIVVDAVVPATLKELLGYRNTKSVLFYYAIYKPKMASVPLEAAEVVKPSKARPQQGSFEGLL